MTTDIPKTIQRTSLVAAMTLILASCAGSSPSGRWSGDWEYGGAEPPKRAAASGGTSAEQAQATRHAAPPPVQVVEPARERLPEIYSGSGRFIDEGVLARREQAAAEAVKGDVVLNFHDADLREVVKAVLGELLKQNYVIDEAVKGKVYLETSRPLPREALIPALESVLRLKGAVLVRRGELYHIVPESALGGHLTPEMRVESGRGYQILLVPLRYVGAAEMRKVLEPFMPVKGQVEVDAARNLLILTGTQTELANLRRTVNLFDVDQFEGMSVGLFPLHQVGVSTLSTELRQVLGIDGGGGIGEMVRLVPVERLNALLVVTPQPEYLRRVEQWIDRLDRNSGAEGLGLHVYQVQNSRAEHLAEVLSELYGEEVQVQGGAKGDGRKSIASAGFDAKRDAEAAAKMLSEGRPALEPAGSSPLDVGAVRIIADSENNALVIKATAEDYANIERALAKLDVMPLQVLVEATIVELTLTDDLSFGLEWYLKHNGFSSNKSGTAVLDLGKAGLAQQVPGFAYTLTDSAGLVRAVLNTLASDSKVHVISSPSLMVLDNHTATINVGDQVPVRTSESSSTATPGDAAVIVSQIQFRDTGVKLEVTPRVNAGGMVIMDITQEVSNVSATQTSSIDSPTISQRQITTSVAVQSQETIVLGGLITEDKTRSSSGVPGLREVPVVGWAFGSKSRNETRKELLVLITPTAVRDGSEARAATEELKQKMKGLELPAHTGSRRVGAMAPLAVAPPTE